MHVTVATLALFLSPDAAAQIRPPIQVLEFHNDALLDQVRACDALLEEGAYREGIEAAQQILTLCAAGESMDGEQQFPLIQDTTAQRLWLSVPLHVTRRLAALPRVARDLHETLYGKLA